MEVIVLKPFMANGKPVQPGTVIDLPVAEAAYVIGIKRAERIEAAPAAAAAVDAPEPMIGKEFGLPEPKTIPPMPSVRKPRKAGA